MNNLYHTLPNELQQEISVVIRETTFRGRPQLQAKYLKYRIVVSNTHRNWPEDGETWLVRPQNTPNGHIVFARPVECVKNRNGQDPVVAKLQSCIGQKVDGIIGHGRKLVEVRIQEIVDVTADDEQITVHGKVETRKRDYVIYRPNGENRIVFNRSEAFWNNGRHGRYTCRLANSEYWFG
jgi:hypothetical protein